MSEQSKARAAAVVSEFRALLGQELAARITDSQYAELALMVRAALAAEMRDTAGAIEELARQTRARAEPPERGL